MGKFGNIIDNSVDFIDDAVKRSLNQSDKPNEIKYILLHLAIGIELLFKTIVVR